MEDTLKSIEYWIFNQTGGEQVIEKVKQSPNKIPLSKILKLSHVLCRECCELYTPCHVGEWIRFNPELYDSEVLCFAELLEECGDHIEIDVHPYSDIEVNTYTHVSEVSEMDRLRQLYTICLSV